MARRHRSYSIEFKRKVVQQYLAGEIPFARLARQHGREVRHEVSSDSARALSRRSPLPGCQSGRRYATSRGYIKRAGMCRKAFGAEQAGNAAFVRVRDRQNWSQTPPNGSSNNWSRPSG